MRFQQGVDHGRIGLHRHADLHSIAIHRGDDWPLLRLSRFFLDERRQRYSLPRRQPLRRGPCTHSVVVDSEKPIDHQINEARRGHLPRQRICFRKEIPFEI
jgi:hypothetical protein